MPVDSTNPTPASASNGTPVEVAKADLAQRLSVAADAIEVVAARNVTWRNGSLGCPEPDMMYTQVLIEGMKIILAVDGEEYHYHSGSNRGPFLCENPEPDGNIDQ